MRVAAFGAFTPKTCVHSGCARTASHPTLVKRSENSNHIPPVKLLHFGREGPVPPARSFKELMG